METYWTIVVASLAAMNCSLIGTYLVLRKLAMMGDAIAHAVLPGIVIAFLVSGARTSGAVLIGAGSVGIIVTLLITYLHRQARLQEDAAIGINFTWLFALGVILLSLFSKRIDLDPDCVLYGEIAYTPLDSWITDNGVYMGPRAVYMLTAVLLMNLVFILLSYKELFITTFDPDFATTIGMNVNLWHYVLMGATSLTTVATFEIVGVVLVVALLVTPPATAYLLTRRLHTMLSMASLIGFIATLAGYQLAVWLNGSIAGAIVTVAGVLFLAALQRQHRPAAS